MSRRYSKGIAVFLLLSFAQEIIVPTTAMALTGGPSQPEVQSFEPIGTNQMVDLTTGDFNYNIPLMVVPGPNGSYPINLAYHAGVGMEQEASWVGLGWNINPGAITRNLRGIPDDFSGDKVVEETSLKKDVTVGIGVKLPQFTHNPYNEWWGFHPDDMAGIPGEFQLYYNNYRGVGWSIAASPIQFSHKFSKISEKSDKSLVGNLSFSFDSQSGLGMNAKVGIQAERDLQSCRLEGMTAGAFATLGIHSRQDVTTKFGINVDRSQGAGISFTNQTYVPAQNMTMTGQNLDMRLTIAQKFTHATFNKKWQIRAKTVTNKLESNTRVLDSYGTLYLQDQASFDDAGTAYTRITDFNVANDIPISKHSVHMGMPILTSDVYMITGQGIGGTFRPHRTDMGTLYKEGNTSHNDNITAGIEFGLGSQGVNTLVHLGVDAGYGYHNSYTGKWTGGKDAIGLLQFQDKTNLNPLYEPVYFKVAGEQLAVNENEWDYMNGEDPVAFDMGLKWEGTSPKPVVNNHLVGSSETVNNRSYNADRVKRKQLVAYRTKDEIVNDDNYANRPEHVDYGSGMSQINYSNMGTGSHLQEYQIIKDDGTIYTYGLPAYNTIQKEKVFSTIEPTYNKYTDYKEVPYEEDDSNLGTVLNDEGYDQYYSSTELPAYVHSNLITKITSADYVDLTDDGPSEDDFGFYAKFNYEQVQGYKWRAPYKNATHIKGYYSNDLDDKASYTYGEKDLYYVQSIETKTHIAVFELGDRNDGLGVAEEFQTVTAANCTDPMKAQKYLKSIKLYSKADLSTPLQEVTFIYDYSLCQGVENNDGNIDDATHILSNDGGKLTLKQVYITYNGNDKGRFSPYQFQYTSNKPYDKLHADRWGNYQESSSTNEHAIHPYTRQDLDETTQNENASAWCLNNITLPSGGELKIEYEADNYGYVQDHRAMQMNEILGFTDINTTAKPTGGDMYRMSKKNLRLWFKMNEPFDASMGPSDKSAVVASYINGIGDMYFKVFEELKDEFSFATTIAKDYVVGYAKIDNSSYGYDPNDDEYAYVDLLPVTYQSVGLNVFSTHPFRKAGWQYLRYQRSDLFHNQNGADDMATNVASNLAAIPLSLGSAMTDALSIAALGYYNKAALLGYCKYFSSSKRSFVRLNSPNKRKYGGGHRTKSVSIADNWIEGARTFGTEYKYENVDGTSSGVADYEPIVGGEENALKGPIWYNGSNQLINFNHIDAFVETPLTEAVYPGARVVYSRVVEQTIADDPINPEVTKSQSGIIVHEFYTSKDFPVKESFTDLEPMGYNFPFYIPFVGVSTYQNNGYSQGYAVELNDMSGRPKAVATHPYDPAGTISGLPISKVEYIYKTDNTGELNNKVTVLDAHGVTRVAIIGVEQDFCIHEEEHNSTDLYAGGEGNLDVLLVSAPPIFIPVPIPSFNPAGLNYSEAMYRGISTTKIIYKTGILDEVRSYTDGSLVTAKNLLYDAETGEPLLSEVTNQWDNPIYNYNYAAHWNYDGFEGAYKNYGAHIRFIQDAGTDHKLLGVGGSTISPENILNLGDEISVLAGLEYVTYYVTEINTVNGTFKLQNAAGVDQIFSSNTEGEIKRSGKRNLQSVKSGSVISRSTAFLGSVGSQMGQQFLLWNSVITNGNPDYDYVNNQYLDFNTMNNINYPSNPDFTAWYMPNYFDLAQIPGGIFEVLKVSATSVNGCMIEVEAGCQGELTFTGITTPASQGYIYPETVSTITGPSTSYTEQYQNFKIISETVVGIGSSTLELLYIPTGEVFTADWNVLTVGEGCFEPVPVGAINNILHADAVTFSDDWSATTPYSDLGNPGGISSASTECAYVSGKRGIWRAVKTHLYQVDRLQQGTANDFKSHIDVDGEYESWTAFDWANLAANTEWDWVTEITMYSPYGYALEEKSRLSNDPSNGNSVDVYSSQMYGYSNSVITANCGNAHYYEIGYTGFEQYNTFTSGQNLGHILATGTGLDISPEKSHTGVNSMKLDNAETMTFNVESSGEVLQGIDGKNYIVSVWVNVEDPGSEGNLTITTNSGSYSANTNDYGEVIDGWKKLEVKFPMDVLTTVTVDYTSIGVTYIDDIRFSPYNGGMTTYVYDFKNLWLLAELDGLNYATFYNYDEEGNLIQVKKETENGVVTVQTSRSNTKQILNP